MRYRKKSIEVTAQQLTDEAFTDEHPNPHHISGVVYNPVTKTAIVAVRGGADTASVGDWIITNSLGGRSVWNNAIFQATFEPIPE
jgi:hypothetical protein